MLKRRAFWVVLLLILLLGGFVVARFASRRAFLDPMREFTRAPLFVEQPWMPSSITGQIARLENTIARTRDWGAEEAGFVQGILDMPPNGPRPGGIDEIEFSFRDATESQMAWFLRRNDAQEILAWYYGEVLRSEAEALVVDRLRAGLNIPEPLHSVVVGRWSEGLSDPDPQVRISSAFSLISARLIEREDLRMKVEALRHGDASADVRGALDRALKHYDRTHHGIDPGGPVAECNTCP